MSARCDIAVDGCTAVVVSSAERVADLRKPAIRIAAMGCASHGRPTWDQREDMTTMATHDAAAMMWVRADLTTADVDLAQLYDGFSILTLYWLEALGFCGAGEAGPFTQGGEAIGPDGVLPLNTAGGQMLGGRLHAFGLLHDACTQLWGGGARQLQRRLEVAAVGSGGGPPASCFLLTGPGT